MYGDPEQNWRFVKMFLMMGGMLIALNYLPSLASGRLDINAILGLALTLGVVYMVNGILDRAASEAGARVGGYLKERTESY